MSIINEALKKAEEHLKKNTPKDNFMPPKLSVMKSFLLFILILLVSLLLGNFIFTILKHKTQTTQTPKKAVQAIIPTTDSPPLPVILNQPIKESKPVETSFVLNGIFFSDNDGYALINNQIVRENDYVDGAKVKEVTTNSVELYVAGKTITLTTPR